MNYVDNNDTFYNTKRVVKSSIQFLASEQGSQLVKLTVMLLNAVIIASQLYIAFNKKRVGF